MTVVIAALCLGVAAAAPSRARLVRPATVAPAADGRAGPGVVHRLWLMMGRSRRRRRLIAALPELVDLIARALRGGANLQLAMAEAAASEGPASESLRAVLARVAAGERLGDGVDRWAAGLTHPDADMVRAVLRLGGSTGGALAVSLERTAATLRERTALADEIRALTAQARASSLVVALAPLGFLGVVVTVDRDSAAVLFTTPLGFACLLTGLLLDAAGIVWMSQIAAAVAR
jgi:tight adherence protein B